MKRLHARWLWPAATVLTTGLIALGCSEESNKLPVGSGVGSTAAGISAPQGPFPRGTPTSHHAIDPTTVGPIVSIVSPARAAQIAGPTVEVRLDVQDPDGVASVLILGTPAIAAPPSNWIAQVQLTPGQNLIDIEATDSLGNRTTSYISVVQGQFLPDDQMLTGSIGVSLTQGGLDRVTDIAEQATTTLNLGTLLLGGGPLIDNTFIKITPNGLAHDPMQFQAAGTSSGVEVVIDLDNVVFDLSVKPIALGTTQAIITADRATVTAQARISQQGFTGQGVGKRALGLEITSIDIGFSNYRLRTSSGALNVVLIPFQGIIENVVRDTLKGILSDVIDDELSKSMVALDLPLQIAIPNPIDPAGLPMDLDLMFQVDEANGAAGVGLGIAGGLQVSPTTPAPGKDRNVLVSGTQILPVVLGPEKFAVSLSSDAANGFLHALYATGALAIEIDGTQPQAAGGLSIPLNAGLLYPFLPQVRELAPDPATPIVLTVELGSAPLISLGQDPTAPFRASVGEAELKVWIDYMDGGPRLELFTLNLAVDIRAQVVVQNNEIVISNLDLSRTRVDITREPTVDIADQEIEDFIVALMPTITNQFLGQIPSIPIPGLPMGLQLSNARVDVQPDVVTVRGDL